VTAGVQLQQHMSSISSVCYICSGELRQVVADELPWLQPAHLDESTQNQAMEKADQHKLWRVVTPRLHRSKHRSMHRVQHTVIPLPARK
jgi:hypothetical protein